MSSNDEMADDCITRYVQNTTSENSLISLSENHKRIAKSLQDSSIMLVATCKFHGSLAYLESSKWSSHPEADQLQVHHLQLLNNMVEMLLAKMKISGLNALIAVAQLWLQMTLVSWFQIGTGLTDEQLEKHTEFLGKHIIEAPKAYYRCCDGVQPDLWFDSVQVGN